MIWDSWNRWRYLVQLIFWFRIAIFGKEDLLGYGIEIMGFYILWLGINWFSNREHKKYLEWRKKNWNLDGSSSSSRSSK